MDFQALDLSRLLELLPVLHRYPTGACDASPGGLFQWREFFKTEVLLDGGTLYGRMRYYDGSQRLLVPLSDDVDAALRILRDSGERLLFAAVTPTQLALMKRVFGEHLSVTPERNIFDYLYDPAALATLSGRRLAGQRNHKNAFLRAHTPALEELSAENLPKARAFLKEHFAPQAGDAPLKRAEAESAAELLEYAQTLGLFTLLLYADGVPVGLCIGERVGDVLYVHVEKALKEVRGAYPYLMSQFVVRYGDSVRCVNREEDDGAEGLRTAKLSLHPIALLEKYTVEVTG